MKKTIIKIPEHTSVLVVDDNEDRLRWFKIKYPEVKLAETPMIARILLGRANFSLVFLDHDCVPGFVDPQDPDFETKTFWSVAQKLMDSTAVVVVHSGNPAGARRMAALLRERPFGETFVYPIGTFEIEILKCSQLSDLST
jgi:hypothetical protein